MRFLSFIPSVLVLLVCVDAAPAPQLVPPKVMIGPYAPKKATCPSSPLVRGASGLSSAETAYLDARKPKADAALKAWITKTSSEFGTGKIPVVGLTTSGGGYRSLLTGAGVIQALDSRDSKGPLAGLYQSLTYQAGLSGGAWLLSSLAGNDYPTVSTLKDTLWKPAFQQSLLLAQYLVNAPEFIPVQYDIFAKRAAGFDPTLNDLWGRLLSYQLLKGPFGGVSTTLSSVTSKSNFKSQSVAFPIITSLGVQTYEGECRPDPNATQYEFTPFEFGSWDAGVRAFTPMQYLGSSLSGGKPSVANACITNYDNLGYMLGSSSNLFSAACLDAPAPSNNSLEGVFADFIRAIHEPSTRDLYAVFPNPFRNSPASPAVAAQKELALVDGGLADQNNPVWPFLQPERAASVLIVNDNSADTSANFPDGRELRRTYEQALAAGLGKMPFIPTNDTFVARGLDKKAAFFGCNKTDQLTIVWIPNAKFTYPSGQSTFKLQYEPDETEGMVKNGNTVAEQGGKEGWPVCVGCALMKKTGEKLPGQCGKCFQEYCFN